MLHSTNDTDTFIAVADDCPAAGGAVLPEQQPPTVARMQYELIQANPYRSTSDDVRFAVYAARQQIADAGSATRRATFFSKGQACLRASPLAKTYGWGIHHDHAGRVAI